MPARNTKAPKISRLCLPHGEILLIMNRYGVTVQQVSAFTVLTVRK
ncbi:hypothetical protein HMPREF1548_02498 [Clostridium sp. KLE 1755]|nr:hypothetical protein HMPREF1548_02498 [Clostridium sp. KLE 1755]